MLKWGYLFDDYGTVLGIARDRLQVICATASFRNHEYAPDFGAQLSGNPANTFLPITGSLDLRVAESPGTEADADILASVDLEQYYKATTDFRTHKYSSNSF